MCGAIDAEVRRQYQLRGVFVGQWNVARCGVLSWERSPGEIPWECVFFLGDVLDE